jgi:hypothetical protein
MNKHNEDKVPRFIHHEHAIELLAFVLIEDKTYITLIRHTELHCTNQ